MCLLVILLDASIVIRAEVNKYQYLPYQITTMVQLPGTSGCPFCLNHSFKGVIWTCKTSFPNSFYFLSWSSTNVSSQQIRWWYYYAYLATTDLSFSSHRHPELLQSCPQPSSAQPLLCRIVKAAEGSNISHWTV